MMKKLNIWTTILLTTILCYVVIGFITWEFDWIKHLTTTSDSMRLWFVGGVIVKLVLDVLLYKKIKSHNNEQPDLVDEQSRIKVVMNKKPHNQD